jgi:prophage tail gpP-like protein
MNDAVTLVVNGLKFAGWISVRIEAGLERLARSFELSVTQKWPGSEAPRIKPGDLCEVFIDDDLVCTGYVDATPISYDAHGITIVINGRSKTGDLIDSSAEFTTGQFKGLSVEAIAKKLSAPYSVNVINETATGAVITDFQIQQGETVFESLDRLSKQRQVLFTDNAAGDVVIASPGSRGSANSALELGINILSGNAGFDFSEVYSSYTVKGQKSGTDDIFGANASQISGTAVDGTIKRRRVLVVKQYGQADANTCLQRANYEKQTRQAKAGEIRYRVAGWRQANGTLWQPNLSVQITDAIMGIDKSLIISECTYTLDDSGMITELVVIPEGAFTTEPEKTKRKKKKSGVDLSWLD